MAIYETTSGRVTQLEAAAATIRAELEAVREFWRKLPDDRRQSLQENPEQTKHRPLRILLGLRDDLASSFRK